MSIAAMESPRDEYEAYARIVSALKRETGRAVELVQRRTELEAVDLLLAGKIDAAFLCAAGYGELRSRAPQSAELAAVPIWRGSTVYRGLVIVPANSPAKRIEDLEGRRFAFTDEHSVAGGAWVLDAVARSGRSPHHFFAFTMFTGTHDRSIEAVARHIVDGAAVHSGIYEHVIEQHPAIARRIRVIARSAPIPPPPFVISTRLPKSLRAKLRNAVLGLDDDPETSSSLRKLGIDRYVRPERPLASDAVGGARVLVEPP